MASRPTLNSDDIPLLVQNVYGLKVKVLEELNSYDDQNFLVELISDSSLPSCLHELIRPGAFCVFKILNSLDSMTPEVTETRNKIILHAERAGFPTPGVIPNLENQYQKLLSLPSSRVQGVDHNLEYITCLFDYMPGHTLDQVTLTLQLCYEVGWFAGKLDVILKGFPTPDHGASTPMTRKWNMSQIPKLRDKLDVITSQEQKIMAEEIIDKFETEVLSSGHKFSKGLIHGDFNDCNILVSSKCNYMSMVIEGACSHSESTISIENKMSFPLQNAQKSDDRPWHVSGVIDFGDATFSFYVFEVAIAIAHTMINKHNIPEMQAASFVLSGYLKHVSLTQDELSHLKLCICARFVQSLTLGYFSIIQDPNNSYILTHAKRVWPVLKSLWEMSDSEALSQIMEHCTNT